MHNDYYMSQKFVPMPVSDIEEIKNTSNQVIPKDVDMEEFLDFQEWHSGGEFSIQLGDHFTIHNSEQNSGKSCIECECTLYKQKNYFFIFKPKTGVFLNRSWSYLVEKSKCHHVSTKGNHFGHLCCSFYAPNENS